MVIQCVCACVCVCVAQVLLILLGTKSVNTPGKCYVDDMFKGLAEG